MCVDNQVILFIIGFVIGTAIFWGLKYSYAQLLKTRAGGEDDQTYSDGIHPITKLKIDATAQNRKDMFGDNK